MTQDQQVAAVAHDQQVLGRLRDWLAREFAPIANDQSARAEFPHHLISRLLVYALITLVSVGHDRTLLLASTRLLELPQVLSGTGHRGAKSLRPQSLVFESVFE